MFNFLCVTRGMFFASISLALYVSQLSHCMSGCTPSKVTLCQAFALFFTYSVSMLRSSLLCSEKLVKASFCLFQCDILRQSAYLGLRCTTKEKMYTLPHALSIAKLLQCVYIFGEQLYYKQTRVRLNTQPELFLSPPTYRDIDGTGHSNMR